MSLRFECKSESKTRIPISRNTLGRNSLQNENPSFKCRRSSIDARARGSGGVPFKPRSMSEERKSLYHSSSRRSSLTFNECKTVKDQRPLADKAYQKKKILELVEYLNETNFMYQITASKLQQPSKKDFEMIFQHLAQFFEPDYVVKRIEEEAPRILKSLCYQFIPPKSSFMYIARTNWPTLLGCLLFLMDMSKFAELIDPKLFFNTAEVENPEEHAILLNYIFTSYISREDNEEEEINFFTELIKSRKPYDIANLQEKNTELNLALEQVQKEMEEINELKASSEEYDEIAKHYENYFSQMRDHQKKKEIACENLSKELTDKETELQNLRDILAQKQASFDAQGFDGKKQMSYYENQKIELSEKLQIKKSAFKKLQNECWDVEMQYAKDLDKGTSICETFNEVYSDVHELTNNILDTLQNVNPVAKNLCSDLTFNFPECRMQLGQKSILQQSNTRKSTLEEIKKKIDSTDLFLNCLATKENEKLQELTIKKSDLSVKIKVTSSQKTKKEHDLNAEEKQALEEVKALEIECDELLRELEKIRALTLVTENKNKALLEEYKELQEKKRKMLRTLNNYLNEQKKLFIHHSKVLEDTKRETEEAGEEIYAVITEKVKQIDT
ncbi:kinetochore protein NDC80 homolog [Trichonephila clavipes]|nr:kinetochore protein NDC80 homolog [Trichonephila clavipes]